MLSVRPVFTLMAYLPLLACVASPSSRTVTESSNPVSLAGFVAHPGQTITIQAVDQNTGNLVTLGTAISAPSVPTRRPPVRTTRSIGGPSMRACSRPTSGSGPETSWVNVQGMISDSNSPYYSPVAWSVGYYTVEGGKRIYGLICSPTTGGPYPVVIYNHGGTGSYDGGNITGVVTPSGWTSQPAAPDGLGQCLGWAKRGWVVAMSAYRGESVNITSASPAFPTPATPWTSDGSVEFCMGEVTDVMALTDLVVNHASSITVGSTSQKVPLNVNGKVFMYGYSHGGCITYRAVQQGAPVTAFSVIEGFTDLRLNYLKWRSNGQPAARAAVAAGAIKPGGGYYLPDAQGVMGYNWRSAHYFASRRLQHSEVQNDADPDLARGRRLPESDSP
jgi:dienelactone hydrolase